MSTWRAAVGSSLLLRPHLRRTIERHLLCAVHCVHVGLTYFGRCDHECVKQFILFSISQEAQRDKLLADAGQDAHDVNEQPNLADGEKDSDIIF
jgi:hypothetical protein